MMLARYVSQHRQTRLVRYFARKCARFMECYENDSNYDFATNGERFVLQVLARHDFRTILDVGANVGDWSRMAHELFPSATIHSFEILRPTYEVLVAATRHMPRIKANACGLLDHTGEITLNTFAGVSTITTMTDYPHEFERQTARGRVITGDEYVRQNGIERIDLLKLDVEGAENLVLTGLEETIRSGRVSIVQFEYGQVSVLTKFLLRDFYGFFTGHGYRLGKIYPDYVDFRPYEFRHEDFRGANYLAVREDRPDLFEGLS